MSYSGWSVPQNAMEFVPSGMEQYGATDPYYGGASPSQMIPQTEYIPYAYMDVERGMISPVISQHFDNFEEILWTGNMNVSI